MKGSSVLDHMRAICFAPYVGHKGWVSMEAPKKTSRKAAKTSRARRA